MIDEIEITRYGNHGWEWSVTRDRVKKMYRTNGLGRGLWSGDKILLGPGQFSVSDDMSLAHETIMKMIERGEL